MISSFRFPFPAWHEHFNFFDTLVYHSGFIIFMTSAVRFEVKVTKLSHKISYDKFSYMKHLSISTISTLVESILHIDNYRVITTVITSQDRNLPTLGSSTWYYILQILATRYSPL